jgi:hypothetical protein
MTAARILLEQWLGGDVRVEESDRPLTANR